MGNSLDGKYKYIDYTIGNDGLSYLIYYPTGIYQGYTEKWFDLPFEKRVEKLRTKIYYEINKFKKSK